MNRVLGLLRRHTVGLGALAASGVLAVTLAAVPSASGAFTAGIQNSTDTAGTATYFHCSDALGAQASTALFQWPLSDGAGATSATDISGAGHPGVYVGTITASTTSPLACSRDGGSAWSLDGSGQTVYCATQQTNPTTFTEEIWFKTSVAGGRLMGFGTGTGASGQYDRHLYVDKNGAVVFGVYANAIKTVQTSGTNYADGSWHYAAATLSSAGMALYVDGAAPITDPTVTTAENDSGYWKVGYDSLGGSWPNVSSASFIGSLRFAAVSTSALSAGQIRTHYIAGRVL